MSKSRLSYNYKQEVKNFYHYPITYYKKHHPVTLGFLYPLIQANKREFHTLKRNCYNDLKFKLLSFYSAVVVFIFTVGIIYYIPVAWLKRDILEFNYGINIYIIYIYFVSLVLSFIFIPLYAFVLTKILLINSIKKRLSEEFVLILSNVHKVKIKDRFYYIFSLKFLKIFLLTSFFVLLPNVLYYIYFDCFICVYKWVELFIYILYINICYNLSNCYINRIKFFSKYNMCNLAYSFILLLLVKISVIFLMPLLLPYMVINYEYTSVNKQIDSIKKNTLNFVKRLPIVHKLVLIKIPNNYAFFNLPLVKFRYNNTCILLNNSNVEYKYISKIKFTPLTMCNSKPNSTIISATQCTKTISSSLMFTYNDRSNHIAIDRLSVVNIPNINTQILRIDQLGFLPKSGFFNKAEINVAIKWKPAEISVLSSNNVLLSCKNTTCCKPLPYSALVEKGVYKFTADNKQEISLPTDFSYLSANTNKYNLDIKTNNCMNNVSPELLNPFVFMMNLPNQNPDGHEFNTDNSNKGKATEDEIKRWNEEDSARVSAQVVREQQTLQNIITPEELAQQSNIIDSSNTEIIDLEYELYKDDLFIIGQDITDIGKATDFVLSSGRSPDISNLIIKPTALYRIMTEYESFFDQDSGNQRNVVEGLLQLSQYLSDERKAINKYINKHKEKAMDKGQNRVNKQEATNKGQNIVNKQEAIGKGKKTIIFGEPAMDKTGLAGPQKLDSVWPRLGFLSRKEYQDAVNDKYNELCAPYYKDNRGDDINKHLFLKKARSQVIHHREKEINDSEVKKLGRMASKRLYDIDPNYYWEIKKITRNKTLSIEERELQLQARRELHQDRLNNNIDKKNSLK